MIPMIIMAIEDEDDRSFMANLYVDYQRLMYKVITSHTTDPWDADDIFQSTLPKLIDKLADLRRMSKDKLTNYIYSTCKNTAINYLRKIFFRGSVCNGPRRRRPPAPSGRKR